MTGARFTIRDDQRFLVVVGWDDELESFLLEVWDSGEQIVALGARPHEIPTVSELVTRVAPFARVDVATVSELRHAARPLSDQARYADPSELLAPHGKRARNDELRATAAGDAVEFACECDDVACAATVPLAAAAFDRARSEGDGAVVAAGHGARVRDF